MTVPTVVKTWQNKAWATGATLFEAKLEQALRVMNSSGTLAGYTSTEDFVGELGKHLKISKVCKNDKLSECIDSEFGEASGTGIDIVTGETYENGKTKIRDLKTAKDLGQDDWGTNTVGFQLNNGSTGIIAYNPKCKQDKFSNQVAVNSCVAVIYDTSGFSRPNELNKDVRTLNATLGSGGSCVFKIDGACVTKVLAVGSWKAMTYEECAGENAISANTETEAGQEAHALGIEKCYGNGDYWAGAVRACGGTDKMLSKKQSAQIADYVYNLPSGTIRENGSIQNIRPTVRGWDTRLRTLGLSNYDNSFYVLTGQESGSRSANSRRYYSSETSEGDSGRYGYTPTRNAICVK